ncbi:response regulator [Pedobacter psychrotolerans]|uniref:response regulator n=1 Tax=Pedobacter psychrotolerans TaxID=1843235 RepID=UPI0014044B9F|nr:response regulator [Pedobacter psychrotolerans]
MKILIADDSELMRIVMKGFFKKFLSTCEISETSNLSETFNLLNKQDFDFLLLDINMPSGDSDPDTVKEILAIQENVKVCMFSGNDKNTLEQDYRDAGAIGFIQKNGDMSEALKEVLANNF